MAKVIITGASDDLIELDGDIREEFGCYDSGKMYLAFSDGTLLSIIYGEGTEAFWRINRIHIGSASYSKHEATDEDKDYSDRVTLEGDITWVLLGKELATS